MYTDSSDNDDIEKYIKVPRYGNNDNVIMEGGHKNKPMTLEPMKSVSTLRMITWPKVGIMVAEVHLLSTE